MSRSVAVAVRTRSEVVAASANSVTVDRIAKHLRPLRRGVIRFPAGVRTLAG